MDVIKKTYKKLSLLYHPDKADNPTDPAVTDKFARLVKAYEALTGIYICEQW